MCAAFIMLCGQSVFSTERVTVTHLLTPLTTDEPTRAQLSDAACSLLLALILQSPVNF